MGLDKVLRFTHIGLVRHCSLILAIRGVFNRETSAEIDAANHSQYPFADYAGADSNYC